MKITVTGGPAGDIHVDDDNDSGTEDGSAAFPYRTVQGAFDNAFDGATILVHAGVYGESATCANNSTKRPGVPRMRGAVTTRSP